MPRPPVGIIAFMTKIIIHIAKRKATIEKMKIAFLSFYSGEVYRGVETFVHEVANRLHDLGNDITVYQNGPAVPGTKYKVVSTNLKIDWNKKRAYIPFFDYYASQKREFTKRVLETVDNDTDIIFPTNGDWQSILCKFWAVKHRKKMVIAGQSGPGLDDRINLYTFPDCFVSLTQTQNNWVKRANAFVNRTIIPNGVDIDQFSHINEEIDFDLPKPIILCVAALDQWKRLDLAIHAVSTIDTSLILVGKGSELKNLQKMGEQLLKGRFKIMSFPHKDMPKVYASAHLFTYPTVPWESFGIVLAEALASGLPIICTDDPIRREIVGDCGIYVDPTDTEAYAAALEEALNKKWDKKKLQARAKEFSWDTIAKEYEKLFQSLLK